VVQSVYELNGRVTLKHNMWVVKATMETI